MVEDMEGVFLEAKQVLEQEFLEQAMEQDQEEEVTKQEQDFNQVLEQEEEGLEVHRPESSHLLAGKASKFESNIK